MGRYSRLIIHVARRVMLTRDDAMDAYAHVLERLRADDCKALRIYAADGRSKFTTWLAVVARRMCVDYYRHAYGRMRGDGNGDESRARQLEIDRAARHRLAVLASASVDVTHIVDERNAGPDRHLREAELQRALDAAMAQLPADDRLLLKLRFEDGLAAREIASALAMPSQFHVYRRINAICEQLRAHLVARGVESSSP